MILRFIYFLTILISFYSKSFAADDAVLVRNFIDDFGNKIIHIADDENFNLEQRKEKLIDLIDQNIDSAWISKFVLAKHYRTASQEQKNRFSNLYRQFMIRTYAPKFKGYNGKKFEVIDSINQGRYHIVKCLFYPKDSSIQVNVDFRLKKKKYTNEFVILDIVAEGVSLISTQRSEFDSVISSKGLDGFMDDLELKVKKLKAS